VLNVSKSSYLRYVDSLGVLKVNNLNHVDEFAGLGRSAAAWDSSLGREV